MFKGCGENSIFRLDPPLAKAYIDIKVSIGRHEPPFNQSINQSIDTFITRHGTEARATVRIMPRSEMS